MIDQPRGRRRKIEVPTEIQPQFELGDTAEDIERRRERAGGERERQRRERERREDSQERTEEGTNEVDFPERFR